LLLVACQGPARPKKAEEHVIVMKDLAFAPTLVSAHVGDQIVWDNQDIVRHSATARDGRFDLDIDPGAKGRATLDRSGRVQVYCRYHPGMNALIDVEP
jgi:plastocyanin